MPIRPFAAFGPEAIRAMSAAFETASATNLKLPAGRRAAVAGLSPPALCLCYTPSLTPPQNARQVLGADLNCAESSRGRCGAFDGRHGATNPAGNVRLRNNIAER
jgi:hypothetical protein